MGRVVWFDGFIDGWPTSYPTGVAETVRVALGGNDRAERLTSLRALRHPLVETFGGGTTAAPARFNVSKFDTGDKFGGNIGFLFPLQEDPRSTTAGDVSGALLTNFLSAVDTSDDAKIEFGQSGILPEGDMVTFTPAGSYRPQLVVANTDFSVYGYRDWTLFAAFALPQAPTGTARLLRLAPIIYPGWPYPMLKADVSATALTVTWSGYAGTTPVSVALTDTVALADGQAHFLRVWHDVSGGQPGMFRMQVDARTIVSATAPDIMEHHLLGLQLGNSQNTDPVSLAWVGWSPTVVTEPLATMVLGLPERSDVRIRRYLRWCGIPDSDMDLEEGSALVGFIPTTDVAALDAIAQVNDVELGVFHVAGDRFVQHSRTHRAASTPVVTLTADQCTPAAIDANRNRLANDWTVSRPGGITYRAINQASILKYGRRVKPSATLPAASDADLRDLANSVVQRYGEIQAHCPAVEIDLLTLDDDTVGRVMRLQVGDLFQIVGLPVTAPGGGDLALYVEGMDMAVAVDQWRLTLATSPAGKVALTRFDNPTTAQFDTSATFAY